MSGVVGVRLIKAGKVLYFDPGDQKPGLNEYVVVETEHGLEIGAVVIAPDQVLMSKIKGDLPLISRMATPEDLAERDRLREQAQRILEETRTAIREERLPMKVPGAHFTLGGEKLIVSYTSDEERLDFRSILRKVNRDQEFRMEFRKIGPRDETKILGGLGRCGRELCCATWLTEFQPISMKMAKEQDLPLSPPGLAGVCGRLRCCLRYEYDQYREMKRGLPRIGAQVSTERGAAVVVVGHPLKQTVTVRIEETGTWAEVPMSEVIRDQQPEEPRPAVPRRGRRRR